eukprot:tig00020704_g13192.t1
MKDAPPAPLAPQPYGQQQYVQRLAHSDRYGMFEFSGRSQQRARVSAPPRLYASAPTSTAAATPAAAPAGPVPLSAAVDLRIPFRGLALTSRPPSPAAQPRPAPDAAPTAGPAAAGAQQPIACTLSDLPAAAVFPDSPAAGPRPAPSDKENEDPRRARRSVRIPAKPFPYIDADLLARLLSYPRMYVLEGGYRRFFTGASPGQPGHKELCEPPGYTREKDAPGAGHRALGRRERRGGRPTAPEQSSSGAPDPEPAPEVEPEAPGALQRRLDFGGPPEESKPEEP